MSAAGDAKKRRAAQAALDYLENGAVIGVGTGSTVNCFIEALTAASAAGRPPVRGAVSAIQWR